MEIKPRQAVIPLAYGRRTVEIRLASRADCRALRDAIMAEYESFPDDGLDESGAIDAEIVDATITDDEPEAEVEAVNAAALASRAAWCTSSWQASEHRPLWHCSLRAHEGSHHQALVRGKLAATWLDDGAGQEYPDDQEPEPVLCQAHGGEFGPADCDRCAAERTVEADRALYVADTAAARSGVLEDVAVCLRPAEHPSAPPGRRVHCDRAAHHAPATDGDVGGEDGGCLQVSPAGDACVRAAGHAVILQTAHRDLHGNEWDDSGWLTGLPENVRPSDSGELPPGVVPLHGAAFIALRSEFLCGSAR